MKEDRLARLEAALVPKKGRFYGKLGLLLSLSIQKIIRSSLLTICILASYHFLILAFGGWGILDAGNEELLKMVSKLQSELEAVKAEHVSEKQKALEEVKKLHAENAKLQYRITHLVRSLKEVDSKLAP
ncbi:hypothetical protein RHGRI_010545 [Rhododendron griersonianum]|uniref:Uncharacterized protein n=1 Tax=Rhododendron griersonianum TaxID=479676 RepID=A0AAV6KJ43_9ERIC|nr:hypothetical protein RHGRI_010545 [Rhododendron griersonianum]